MTGCKYSAMLSFPCYFYLWLGLDQQPSVISQDVNLSITYIRYAMCPTELETPEEVRRMHQLKHCEYNTKGEDNSPDTLHDKK